MSLDQQAVIFEKFLTPEIISVMKDQELIECINAFFKNNLNICDLSIGNYVQSDYNILDLESYHDLDDQFTVVNYINTLIPSSSHLFTYVMNVIREQLYFTANIKLFKHFVLYVDFSGRARDLGLLLFLCEMWVDIK